MKNWFFFFFLFGEDSWREEEEKYTDKNKAGAKEDEFIGEERVRISLKSKLIIYIKKVIMNWSSVEKRFNEMVRFVVYS